MITSDWLHWWFDGGVNMKSCQLKNNKICKQTPELIDLAEIYPSNPLGGPLMVTLHRCQTLNNETE